MIHTQETRRRLSQMHKAEGNPFFGKKHSPETRERLAAQLRIYNKNRSYTLNPPTVIIPGPQPLAYLAGIIDGEGSIRFRGGRPFVAVYNSNAALKEWMLTHTGIPAGWSDYRGRVPGWTWQLNSAMNVLSLCKAVLPLLVVKQDDARAAIAHIENRYSGRLVWVKPQI